MSSKTSRQKEKKKKGFLRYYVQIITLTTYGMAA